MTTHATEPHDTSANAVEAFIRRYVALTDTQACALTLFVVHTHAFEASESTPYMRISSVGAGAGKTRCLEVLELLTANPWLTGRVTGPALVRKIAAEHPTLLLDETDALFTGGNASQQMLRGVLNSGYRLGGKVAYARGSSYEEELDVYCPKAFAGIGGLPTTVADRSVPILMKKRSLFDKVERLRMRDVRPEARLPRMLAARFAAQNLDTLTRARPEIPRGLDDRAADVWEPLLAIADVLGGAWPARARKAALELCAARRDQDTDSLQFRLLAACREVFGELDADRLKTVTLVERLRETEFGELDGRLLDARLLADALRPFGVDGPKKLRFGRVALQGYEARAFAQAWSLLDSGPGVVPVPTEMEVR